ncbi:photosynthetic complex putative assembly protein PuhB [Rhodopila sp.]|uniref:photosynthetic complex putative assembly protein PuhB n=1 Tax=Rhodopila sp. TaxID=2480087 RepID=UPI003D0CE2D1
MNGHDHEPVRGLPAPLPDGETILWQGGPNWQTLARRAMRVRVVTVYFVLLAVWGISGGVSAGTSAWDIALSTLRLGALGMVAVAILALFAWLVARTTVYTITTRRVVIRFGIALPITLQVAFPMINTAGVHLWSGGHGDIALVVQPAKPRISYFVMWPHVRPWKMNHVEPMLRCVPDAAGVAQILGRALAASASQPAQAMPVSAVAGDSSAHVPAAA